VNGDSVSSPSDTLTWRELAEKASHEMDPKKLIELVQRLCAALEKESASRRETNTESR
jgi:hypothetical protein